MKAVEFPRPTTDPSVKLIISAGRCSASFYRALSFLCFSVQLRVPSSLITGREERERAFYQEDRKSAIISFRPALPHLILRPYLAVSLIELSVYRSTRFSPRRCNFRGISDLGR